MRSSKVNKNVEYEKYLKVLSNLFYPWNFVSTYFYHGNRFVFFCSLNLHFKCYSNYHKCYLDLPIHLNQVVLPILYDYLQDSVRGKISWWNFTSQYGESCIINTTHPPGNICIIMEKSSCLSVMIIIKWLQQWWVPLLLQTTHWPVFIRIISHQLG